MSREIKFRAWLKDAKCFAEIRHISFFEGNTVVKIYDQPMNEEVWFELEDLELLQYTGLKDKNGVEIYELDKIKGKFKGGQHFVMIVGWNEKKTRFDLYTDKRGNRYGFSAGTVDMGNIEIIGNLLEANS